jgi:hypothetical protein
MDGSVSENSSTTSCAFFISETHSSGSWCLSRGSSVFSAELQSIKQALATIYTYDLFEPSISFPTPAIESNPESKQ